MFYSSVSNCSVLLAGKQFFYYSTCKRSIWQAELDGEAYILYFLTHYRDQNYCNCIFVLPLFFTTQCSICNTPISSFPTTTG